MFPRIEYLHWIEGRPEASTYDLGSSDLRGSDDHADRAVPQRLADRSSPRAGSLRADVAEVYGVDAENVLLTAGASMANAIAVGAALSDRVTETGDQSYETEQVLVEKPGYEPLLQTPRAFGARIDRFLRPEDGGYVLEPDRIAGAVGEDAAMVSITNRHNPSGRLADRDRLAEAAAVVADADARLLVDEVYAPYATTAGEGAFGGPTAAGLDRTVVTGSLTKFHGFGGLRIGWLIADREFVATAREVAAHFPVVSAHTRTLARRALAHRETIGERSRELVANNHEQLRAFVDGRDDLQGTVFPGSTIAFLGHERADGDAVAAAAEERDLLVIPGRFFDDVGKFRVSLGRDPDHVAAALDVLGEVLDGV